MKKIIPYVPIILSGLLFTILQTKIYNLGISYRDEGFLVNNAWQINQGKIPYKDFFLTTTPLTFYTQSILFRLFGNYLITDRIFYIALILILLYLANKIFYLKLSSSVILLCSIALSQVGAGAFSFYNIETLVLIFLSLLVIGKFITVKHKYLIFVLGMICGILFLFKQSVGGAIIIGYFIAIYFYTDPKNLLYYFLGISFATIPFLFYFYINNALSEMIYYTFFFASSVKTYGFPFIYHRIIPIIAILIYGHITKKTHIRSKLIFVFAGLITTALYILSDSQKTTLFLNSLRSFLFYFQILFYGITLKLLLPNLQSKKNALLPIYAIILLSAFFGYALSGYSIGTIITIFPLLVLLLFYLYENTPNYKLLYKSSLLIFILSTIAYTNIFTVITNFSKNSKVFNVQLVDDSKYFTDIPQLKNIKVTIVEKNELEDLDRYVNANLKPSDYVFCFPYCPMINYLNHRHNSTYFSFFFGETFAAGDQIEVINKLKTSQHLLIVQKMGLIEPEAEYENSRLNILVDYLNSITTISESGNFRIKR